VFIGDRSIRKVGAPDKQQAVPFPLKIAHLHGGHLDLRLTHGSLGPPKSTVQLHLDQFSSFAGSLNSTENYGRRCLTRLSSHHYDLTIINKHCHFTTSSDRFPVGLPVRSAVKSHLTALSKINRF